ncbi:MAG: Fe-S oxidoreductase [Desulfobacca sp.]|nr:Fe-S oxidoreductase [Desulfobacca sp.]
MESRVNMKTTLFIPCLMDMVYPQMARDLTTLFKNLGFEVHYPQAQTCCGQPAFNQGFIPEAKKLARRFLTIFDSAEQIICPSGSCTAMVRKHYAELFSQEPQWLAKAQNTAQKIFEVSEFLIQFVSLEKIKASFPFTVTYHDSCHSNRVLSISEQPRKLLAQVKGLTLVEMESSQTCCGFGGLFSQKFPLLSQAIGMEKLKAIQNTGAQWVISNDPGCLMHIQNRLREKKLTVGVKHLVEVLASHPGYENKNGTV